MLPTFVIGLREGLEASLIVGIVAAFLNKHAVDRSRALRSMWIGVSAAVALCIAVGVGLHLAEQNLPQRQQERLETVIGVIAAGMVTWMILWMRKHARFLKKELESRAASAVALGSFGALVLMAFLAVLREGFETAVFLVAAFQNAENPSVAGTGAILGLLVAVGIGYAIYRGGLHINLAKFFRVTGVVLVLVAAGIVSMAMHTAHEGGWINFGQSQAMDLSAIVKPGSAFAALVTGMLGVNPRPTIGETVVWALYLFPMLAIVLWPTKSKSKITNTTDMTQAPEIRDVGKTMVVANNV